MMKMKLIFGALLFSLAFLTSCKDEKKETPAQKTTQPAPATANASAEKKELKYNPEHGAEGHRCDLPVGAPLANADAVQQESMQSPVRIKANSPAINPPHGEPGHDCSKPVGSRLD